MVSDENKKFKSDIRNILAGLKPFEYADFDIARARRVHGICWVMRTSTGDNFTARKLESEGIIRVYRLPGQ